MQDPCENHGKFRDHILTCNTLNRKRYEGEPREEEQEI